MSTTTISPNMNLPVPTVGEDTGPDWATNLNACLSTIDGHTHAAGSGVQVTPDGLDINADLSMGSNNLTLTRTVRFAAQTATLALSSDVGCLYEAGVDLYYNDGSGNQVRITQSGSVTGASGTITGLPSGTASASFAGGTFTWQSATNTPATMNSGPLVTGAVVANAKTVTLQASAAQPSNYALTFPVAAPAADQLPISDGSGNLSWKSSTGTGSVVLATSPTITTPTITTPTFSGTPAGTITGGSFSPSVAWTKVGGSSIVITLVTSTWYYTRVGAIVTVSGIVTYSASSYVGNAFYVASVDLPVATASLTVAGSFTDRPAGGGLTGGSLTNTVTTAVKEAVSVELTTTGTGTFTMNYMYQVS